MALDFYNGIGTQWPQFIDVFMIICFIAMLLTFFSILKELKGGRKDNDILEEQQTKNTSNA